MADNPLVEHPFPSATYEWKRVKVRRPPQGTDTARRKPHHWRLRSVWRRSQPLSLRVTYTGGAEGYFAVESRGITGWFSGTTCLEDVMARIYNEHG